MEESEKRRERLRAMRMEAVGIPDPCLSSPSPSSLSNPLLERPEEDSNAAASRFGFYTDPMAAFSSDKRRTGQPSNTPRPHFSPSPTGPRNPEFGVNQFPNSYSPYRAMHQSGDSYYSPDCPTSPMGIRNPYPMHQGSPNFSSTPGRGQWLTSTSNRGSGPGSSPYHAHQGTPNFQSPPGRGRWYNSSPGSDLGRGRGRGWSRSPSMGRGRGRWDGSGMSPGSRYSGGRGRGSDVDFRARSFYNKSMVEDPWESLTPVIWKGENVGRSNFGNWESFKKTPSAKKPRVSDTFDASKSKESLADFLAASFDEAVGDAAGV